MSKKKKDVIEAEIVTTEVERAEVETTEVERAEVTIEKKDGFFTKLGRGIKARGPKIVGIGAGVLALGGAALMMWNEHQETRNLMALEVLKASRDADGDEEGEGDAENSDETAESETEE